MDASTSVWNRFTRRAVGAAYLAVVATFVFVVARFYEPGAGFAYLVTFGAKLNLPQISEFRRLNYFLQNDGVGYDAQYYAQVAMHPSLREPELKGAVDNLPYRARRILMGWSSYAMGLGRPAWILQAYALQNILAWFALAAILLRWFPPINWSNVLRWGGVLFCAGMSLSVRHALVDGPSLLLIALGVWCVERNRPWLATGVMALAGLGKETNLLAGVALVNPEERTWRAGGLLVLRGVLMVVPLALWLYYIHVTVGPAIDVGTRNFNAPLLSYVTRWRHTLAALQRSGWGNISAQQSFVILIALTTQALFLIFRPRLRDPWWRIGAGFAVLMIVLGTAVWEGFPGAAVRVLLPMQLAFNVLVPRTWRWLAVLVLGNLTLFCATDFLQTSPGYGYHLTGPSELLRSPDGDETARVTFDRTWFEAERKGERYWRWSRGDAGFDVINPLPHPVIAAMSFYVDGLDRRRANLRRGNRVLWSGMIGEGDARVDLNNLELVPGRNAFELTTDQLPKEVGGQNSRDLAFSLRNLEIRVLRAATAP
jgi:hypothetical protein